MHEEIQAGEKPKKLAGHAGRGGERRFEDDAPNSVVGGEIDSYGGPYGLTERDDGLGIEASCVDEVLIGRLGVQVEAGFSRFAFAVAVAAIFQRKDVGGRVAQEFVGGSAIGDIGSVPVECEESESCVRIGNPPGMQPGAVGSGNPDVLRAKRAWMPVAFEAAWIVGEENHVVLK